MLLKRSIDISVSVLGLILLAPLLAFIWLIVRTTMGTPVLFSQARAGFNERKFVLWKFRTMSHGRDSSGALLADEDRLTSVGRFLRRTSLDELPQFWNILKGDMSLVGPRPLLSAYVNRYNEFQRRRLEVRPGVTGWAQIHGRNALSWEEKFAHDVWYVDHQSFWLDVKILFATAWKVLRGDGVSQSGHATMPEFIGTAEAPRTVSPRMG